MIEEYHRPETIQEALALLSREGIKTLPMGGGTVLNRPYSGSVAVVDLQSLDLDQIEARGNNLFIGATATLRELAEWTDLNPELLRAVKAEANYNLRNAATVAGSLVAAGGRSSLAAAMLALDAQLLVAGLDDGGSVSEEVEIGLGDFLPLREEKLARRLITRVRLPLNIQLRYEGVARTPADVPLLMVAAAQWPSGRTRFVVGGFGNAPRLALDGPDATGAQSAVRSALTHSQDQWASVEYRQEAAAALTRRILNSFSVEGNQE